MTDTAIRTATSPEILSPATWVVGTCDTEGLIDEALRIAKLTLEETAAQVERVSPGSHGAECFRRLAESMGALLDTRNA